MIESSSECRSSHLIHICIYVCVYCYVRWTVFKYTCIWRGRYLFTPLDLTKIAKFFWLFGGFSVRRCSTGTTYSSISVDEKKHQRGGGWRLCTDSRRKQQGFSRIGICSGRALCAPEQFIEIFI